MLLIGRIYKPEPKYKDGLEPIFRLFVFIIFGVTIAMIPASYLWAAKGMHHVKLINIHPIAPLLFCIEFGSVVLVAWVFVFLFVSLALLYTNTTRKCLDLMK